MNFNEIQVILKRTPHLLVGVSLKLSLLFASLNWACSSWREGDSLGISSGVLLLHHSQALGAVKALTISWALLGVKDAQDLFGAPL